MGETHKQNLQDEKLSDYLEHIPLNGGNEFICIKLFHDTPIRDTQYIKIDILDSLLKYNVNPKLTYPNLFYCNKIEKEDGKTIKRFQFCNGEDGKPESNLSLDDLIRNAKGVYLFCKEYYPEVIV